MQIIKAEQENLDTVKFITHETISAIYPRYYPMGVVDFFLSHHSDENIQKDIASGCVFLLMDGAEAIGTVTIKKNEICRLFVLPEHQHKGFGRKLLDFAEERIAEKYTEICLASSLPAKHTYLKRGYVAVEAHTIVADNGDVLCYDLMKKSSNYKNKLIDYDGKAFVPKMNTENGEVDGRLELHEDWQWLNGDESKGKSVIVEV